MPEPEYKIRVPQLKMLRDILARKIRPEDEEERLPTTEEAVSIFVEHYVHEEKKDVVFWTDYALKIKADPKFIDNFIAEQKAAK